ncbi:MipA/OmpV family protein [Kangiella taiwanensis]|uniref:MipA/OmpV family protein n=1 Tax=Kangiella taiwanensis TaxID=1079179 RepID=A0ABP8I2T1_9GAMM|nr:MipA/OmpV family protein [Kangiella taiwanensis]
MNYLSLTLTFLLMVSVASSRAAEVTIESIDTDPELTELEDKDNSEQRDVGEWHISVSLGYGQVESIIGNVDDYDLYLLPRISYYGDNFFLENTTMGYSLYEDQDFYIDLVGRLNEDGIYVKLDDFGVFSALGIQPPLRNPRLPPPPNVERDISYLGGVAANYTIAGYALRAGYYHDITDVHYGYEVDFHVSKNFMLTDQWSLYLSTGANHKSKKLLNYYYGTTGLESVNPFFRYQPNSSGTNYLFSLNSEYAIDNNWSWQLLFKRTFLSDEITDSMIIDTQHTDTYFFGIKYTF